MSRRWIAFSAMFAVLVVAIATTRPRDATIASSITSPRPDDDTADAPTPAAATLASESAHRRVVRRAPPEPGEDPQTQRWDDIPAAERIDVLRRDLLVAVAGMESGDDDPRLVAIAQDALSALRVELYGSERGRATHRELEERVDRAMETIAPATEPEGRP